MTIQKTLIRKRTSVKNVDGIPETPDDDNAVLAAVLATFRQGVSRRPVIIRPEKNDCLPVRFGSDGAILPDMPVNASLRRFAINFRNWRARERASGLQQIFLAGPILEWKRTTYKQAHSDFYALAIAPVRLIKEEPGISQDDIRCGFLQTDEPVPIDDAIVELDRRGVVIAENGTIAANPAGLDLRVHDKFYIVHQSCANASATQSLDPHENATLLLNNAIRTLLGLRAYPVMPGRQQIFFDNDKARPLDADQKAAALAILRGENCIVWGPPGTGKTDTIVAVARSCAVTGHSILIASAVPSALDVARRRLKEHARKVAFASTADAVFLSTTALPYDIVIIDEATRASVPDLFLLASKGHQIVVVGDPQQTGLAGDLPGLAANAYEHAAALKLPTYMLQTHYRSQHEHLIYHSNMVNYRGMLKTVPTPDRTRRTGLSVHALASAGCSEAAALAAERGAVCARLAELARENAETTSRRSVCVIAPSSTHAASTRLAIAAYFQAHGLATSLLNGDDHEPFMVRTVFDIQGEERDIVLVTLGFVAEDGLVRQRAGVTRAEGHPTRRLNVMMSRARQRCEIYHSVSRATLERQDTEAAAALAVMLAHCEMLASAPIAIPLSGIAQSACKLIQVEGAVLDNLGLLHAWARSPDAPRYDFGLLYRNPDFGDRDHWNAAAAQLRLAGWELVEYGPDDVSKRLSSLQAHVLAVSAE